jgi:DNA-binding CsgD family transcriptional regulator
MQPLPVDVAPGFAALHTGKWHEARSVFEAVLLEGETPEALEGLSQAWWWTGEEDKALALRQKAHTAFRRRGDRVRALRCALWISDEYRNVYGDHAAANGWFARAQRLLDDPSAEQASGWVALARASRTTDPITAEAHARLALTEAERWSDTELEAYALAQLGLARVTQGAVKDGLSHLDEAMAIATSQANPVVAGDVACSLMQAAEMIGDMSPFMGWAPLVERYMVELGHSGLIASCGTCCGEVFAANGNWAGAETELLRTITALQQSGHRSRCSHPAAALASLRIRQGRLEEAESILAPFANLPETIEPAAALLIAQGHPAPAVGLLGRRLGAIGDNSLRAVPLLSLLAEAMALRGDSEGASQAAARLERIATASGLDRIRGLALLARARSQSSDRARAVPLYEQAIGILDAVNAPLEAAVSRLELARLVMATDRDVAIAETRTALGAFDRLGATHEADRAAALLRSLGVRGQTGAKGRARLTERETEVLDLVTRGMTNSEIADRLFISQKTAANHVSNILMKLGVRSRTEAAAVTLRS